MAEAPHWRLYPAGILGSSVRAVSSALVSIPLVAVLLILPFLAAWNAAAKGALGSGASGDPWVEWARFGLGLCVLGFALGVAVAALLNLLRTVLTMGALRRAARQGARAAEVPHPAQWAMAAEWSGASLVTAAVLVSAVLTFPVVLTGPVREWVDTLPVTEPTRLVAIPVIVIGMVGVFRSWRKRAVAELEQRWPEQVRAAAEQTAKDRVPIAPTDDAGEPQNPTTLQRSPLDALGDRINTAGIVFSVVALFDGAITIPVASTMMGSARVRTPVEALLLNSSLILVAVSIVLFALGGVLQSIGQSGELRELFARAQSPTSTPPTLGATARAWQVLQVPWANPVGLLGAVGVLLALPALLAGNSPGGAAFALAVSVLLLVSAAAVDVAGEQRTREGRNLVLHRWPMPDPSYLMKSRAERADAAVEADVQRYGTGSARSAGQPGQTHRTRPPQPYGAPAQTDGAPPAQTSPAPSEHPFGPPLAPTRGRPNGSPYDPPPYANAGYPPPAAATPARQQPAAAQQPSTPQRPSDPPQPSARGLSARRGWGLPKKLRKGGGLGGLYR